jgi:hypothetical protein
MIALVYVNAEWHHLEDKLNIQVSRAGRAERKNFSRAARSPRDVLEQLTVLVDLLRDWGYHVHYGRRVYAPTQRVAASNGVKLGDSEWREQLVGMAEELAVQEEIRKARWEAIRAARKIEEFTDPEIEDIDPELEIPGSTTYQGEML